MDCACDCVKFYDVWNSWRNWLFLGTEINDISHLWGIITKLEVVLSSETIGWFVVSHGRTTAQVMKKSAPLWFLFTGGLSAVIWTDFAQVFIMVIGAFVLMGISKRITVFRIINFTPFFWPNLRAALPLLPVESAFNSIIATMCWNLITLLKFNYHTFQDNTVFRKKML